jgi:hypothetical protein
VCTCMIASALAGAPEIGRKRLRKVVHNCSTKAAIFGFRSARDCVELRARRRGGKGNKSLPFHHKYQIDTLR